MATYSVNEVTQVIVANKHNGDLTNESVGRGDAATVVGVDNTKNSIFIKYVNALGQIVKSDYINVNKIRSIKVSAYVPYQSRVDKLTLTTDDIVAGQNYSIRILFREWGSGSVENQYVKYVGSVKAGESTTPNQLLTSLKALADANFSGVQKELEFTVNGDSMYISSVPQKWILGKMQGRMLNYDIQCVAIEKDGAPFVWLRSEGADANLVTENAGSYGNGTYQDAADQEYFYHGFVGDTYRNTGWPYTWDTKYLVNPSMVYDAIDIHYFYSDEREGPQASEKRLLILCGKENAADVGVVNSIVSDINTAIQNINGETSTLQPLTAPATVKLTPMSLGVAGNKTVTGLTSGKKYKVKVNAGSNEQVVMNVAADGSLTTGAAANLGETITAVKGLINGTVYEVVQIQ